MQFASTLSLSQTSTLFVFWLSPCQCVSCWVLSVLCLNIWQEHMSSKLSFPVEELLRIRSVLTPRSSWLSHVDQGWKLKWFQIIDGNSIFNCKLPVDARAVWRPGPGPPPLLLGSHCWNSCKSSCLVQSGNRGGCQGRAWPWKLLLTAQDQCKLPGQPQLQSFHRLF